MINSFWAMKFFFFTMLCYLMLVIADVVKWYGENRAINDVLLILTIALSVATWLIMLESYSDRSVLMYMRDCFAENQDFDNVTKTKDVIRSTNWMIYYSFVILMMLLMQLVKLLNRF